MFWLPYKTFPYIDIGFMNIQVFGLCVAVGVMIGIGVAGRYCKEKGVDPDIMWRNAPWLVLVGVVGARITYVFTNYDELDGPLDAFAIWKGGLQFTGGAVLASVVALPLLRRFTPAQRWHFADAVGLGLIIGQAIGRIGCYAVGEHFGGPTSLPFGVRWEGGTTREPAPAIGTVFHQTAAYEAIHLLILFVALLVILRRRTLQPGTLIGVFALWYGGFRLLTDFLRVNDKLVWGLTGAQYGCLFLLGVGAWIIATTKERVEHLNALAAAEAEKEPVPAAS